MNRTLTTVTTALALVLGGMAACSEDKGSGANGGSGGDGGGGGSSGGASGGSSGGASGANAGSGGSSAAGSGGAGASGGAAAGSAGSTAGAGGTTGGTGGGAGASGSSGAAFKVASTFTCPTAGLAADPLPAEAMRTATLIKAGYKHGEGPVWVKSLNGLLFSDLQDMDGAASTYWRQNTSSKIYLHTPGDNMVVEWSAASGTNGMALSHDGTKLLVASIADRTISSLDLTTKMKTAVHSKIADKTFNVTNDLTVRSDNNVYFSDPLWQADLLGIDAGMPPAGSMKVYRASPQGAVSMVDDQLTHPNGMALSPDGRTLYVTALVGQASIAPTWSGDGKLRKYPVNEDGSTGAGADFAADVKWPDGVTTDCAGNVYTATGGGVIVFKADGTKIGTIVVPDANMMPTGANNLGFGGDDHKTLFITGKTLSSIKLNVPGPN